MSPFPTDFYPFASNLEFLSVNSLSFEEDKMCRLGKSKTLLYLSSVNAFNFGRSKNVVVW